MVKTKQFSARELYAAPTCKSVIMQSCKMLCQSRQFTHDLFDEVSGGGIGNLDGVDTGDDL